MARLLTLIVTVLALLAGCGDSEVDEPADLAPEDVPLYGEVVIRPPAGQRADIERLASRFLEGDTLGSTLEKLIDDGLAETSDAGPSPTYRQDIRAWLGARAAGFMTDFDPEEGVVLVETTDEDAAQRFIDKAAKADRTKETSKSHEGTEYLVDALNEILVISAIVAFVGAVLAAALMRQSDIVAPSHGSGAEPPAGVG